MVWDSFKLQLELLALYVCLNVSVTGRTCMLLGTSGASVILLLVLYPKHIPFQKLFKIEARNQK